jgi:hypothetical protein
MTGLLVVAGGVSVWYSTDDGRDTKEKTDSAVEKEHEGKLKDFYAFRRRYITVYLVIMLADWMQGTVSYSTPCSIEGRLPHQNPTCLIDRPYLPIFSSASTCTRCIFRTESIFRCCS